MRAFNLIWCGVFAFMVVLTAAAQDKPNTTGEEGKVAIAHVFRSADIIGLDVRNKAGENLGSINDLVVDMKSGDVRYAALSFGGFAGFGNKLFAVPWNAMTFKMGEPNKASARYFIFDVTKEQLERAPGFDSSHWPNVADPKWAASIDKHYNVERTGATDGDRPNVAYETVFRASKIKGMDVLNDANEDLGDVNEIAIDVTKGMVKYLVLSHGTILTGGNKLFAVPLSAITLAHANDKTFVQFNVSLDALKNAPGFDQNHWPNLGDPTWTRSVDTYYERTARRPVRQ